MIAARLPLSAVFAASALTNVAVAQADPGCSPGGPPAGAASRPFDGGIVWVSPAASSDSSSGLVPRPALSPDGAGLVGVTTAEGTGSVQVPSASPMPLQALVIDAEGNGDRQLIVSNGRVAHLYVLPGCQIATAVDAQGEPFLFDLENLRGNGTGIGCSDLGDGRHLVGLQALPDADGYVVRRTEIDLAGTTATIGRSDTVTGASQQDPAVASALTISCGELTMNQDGVQQP